MKAKEYLLIKKLNLLEMNILINESLKNGWELYGNPIIVYDSEHEDPFYAQALVKYEKA